MKMIVKKMAAVSVFTAALLVISTTIGYAAQGVPFQKIEYKLDQILELLTNTDSEVADIESKLDDPNYGLMEIKNELRAIEEKLDNTAKLAVVKITFSTQENSETKYSLDYEGGLSYFKIKRYTLTVNPRSLVTASQGVDHFFVVTGVLDDQDVSWQVEVFRKDISTMSPTPRAGTAVPPFAGTNTFVVVDRGNDGLGTVEVTINAFIELEP